MNESNLNRFIDKIEFTDICWLWTAYIDKDGYGNFWLDGITRLAHRVSYEWFVGEIPEGLQIDHLCRVRNCGNPTHLEAVTCKVNIRRGETGKGESDKTHCPQSHEYSIVNTYIRPITGKRACRECHRIQNSISYHKQKLVKLQESGA